MKSLAKTLPRAEEFMLWGTKVRTNLEAVKDFVLEDAEDADMDYADILADMLVTIGAHDIKVERSSVIRRGDRVQIVASVPENFGAPIATQEKTVFLKKCAYCGVWAHPLQERERSCHRRGCRHILAAEVMES